MRFPYKALLCIALLAVTGCNRNVYNQLPSSRTVVPPWFSSFPPYPNNYGFKNLGTAYSPTTMYLSDNVADGGDVVAIAVNGQVVLDNYRIHTPDVEAPHPLSLVLKPGPNRVDVGCRLDPDGMGCTLLAEISNTTVGQGISTLNDQNIPEGQIASFIVEYRPAQ